ASANRSPQKEALVHGDRRLTYSEVASRVNGLAQGLRNIGLVRGDRIGIHLEPCIEQAISIFAISQAGGVFVPINTSLFPNQVAHIAQDCGMKGLITSKSRLALLGQILTEIPSIEFLVVTDNGEIPEVSGKPHSFDDLSCAPTNGPWRDQGISKDLA